MEDLPSAGGARTWRSAPRSATAALAELLSGRRFAEMEPFLERVWTASLRSVDDIKETVREAGKALIHALGAAPTIVLQTEARAATASRRRPSAPAAASSSARAAAAACEPGERSSGGI